MRRIILLLVALAAAGVIGFTASASRVEETAAAPLFVTTGTIPLNLGGCNHRTEVMFFDS